MRHERRSWTVVDMTGIPDTDVDLFTDEALSDPNPLYRELLAFGPVEGLQDHVSAALAFEPVRDVPPSPFEDDAALFHRSEPAWTGADLETIFFAAPRTRAVSRCESAWCARCPGNGQTAQCRSRGPAPARPAVPVSHLRPAPTRRRHPRVAGPGSGDGPRRARLRPDPRKAARRRRSPSPASSHPPDARDIDTARALALDAVGHLDVAATYKLDELRTAIDHVDRPGKTGTVVVTTS
jgi:hypothetical protein